MNLKDRVITIMSTMLLTGIIAWLSFAGTVTRDEADKIHESFVRKETIEIELREINRRLSSMESKLDSIEYNTIEYNRRTKR